MQKGIVALLAGMCVVATAMAVLVTISGDRTAPAILFPDSQISYAAGADTASLLEDVTATDDRDGDVSSSLIVENVLPNENGIEASVLYVAKDSHNNIAKVYRTVTYITDGSVPVEAPTDEAEPEADTTDTADAAEPADTAEPEDTTEPENTDDADTTDTTGGEAANEAAIAQLSAGSPRFYLREYELTIPRGSEMNRLSYVENIEDNEDSRDDLYRGIQIDGSVDTNTAGVYELRYHVVDSDGNSSNVAVLTVTVE